MTQLQSRPRVPPVAVDAPVARQLLRSAMEEAVSLLRADGGLVYLLDADGQTLRLLEDAAVAVGDAGFDIASAVAGLRIQIGSGLFGTAVRDGTVVHSDDYLADDSFRHDPGADRFVITARVSSMVVAPLAVGGQVLGGLGVFARRRAAFAENDAALVRSLAAHAATTVANTMLIDELDRSEQRYRGLLAASPDIVFAVDPAGRFTFLGDTLERQLGWRVDEMVGQHFSAVIDASSLPVAQERWTELRERPGVVLDARFLLIHRDGRRIPFEIRSFGLVGEKGFAGVQGAARDISDRERLERDLRAHAATLAAAEERSHLARELHDSVTQALFSMTLVTRSIELLLDRDLAAARGRLATLGELQKDALAEMRALIFELRPGSLETDGLVTALRTHCAAVEGRLGLPVVIEADDEAERFPPNVEAALFRIAQEALTNVVKHSAAQHVRIALERSSGVARLTVEDDGVGLDLGEVPEGHLGIVGMRARAEKLGGTLDIASAPGRGATIRVEVPLARAAGQ